jgi:hypothetical protein
MLTRITRSTENGDLITTTVKNTPNPGSETRVHLWNTNDRKISKLSLANYPYSPNATLRVFFLGKSKNCFASTLTHVIEGPPAKNWGV